MIVKMKNLTLFAMAKDQDLALERLRELGVVHVTPVQVSSGDSLEEVRQRGAVAKEALEELMAQSKAGGKGGKGSSLPDARTADSRDPAAVIAQVSRLLGKRKELREHLESVRKELERVAVLGDFDVQAPARLAEKGVAVQVLEAGVREVLRAPEGYCLQLLGHGTESNVYALLGLGEIESDIDLGAPYALFKMPERSPAELRGLADEAEAALAEVQEELRALAPQAPLVEKRVAELAEDLQYLEVKEGMGRAESLCYMQGYVPEDSIESLRDLAQRSGWGLVVREPRSGEQVPTLIRYPRMVKPIKTLFDVLKILPSYWESDVSWTFLIFFTIFVGLLIGDACYGLLMLGAAVFLLIRKKGARQAAMLLLILSLSVIFFGVITGSWLGIKNLPSFLAALKIDWLSDTNNLMNLTFLIGAIHISLAHIWNAISEFPRLKFLAEIGWLLVVWSMYFLASSIVLGNPLPAFEFYLLIPGVVLVILFMTPPAELRANMINHFLLPLTLVSFFTDIISYVRLFAVGVATVAVMDAFNGMAMSIGFGNMLTGAAAVLILLFGHSLNLVLAGLAVLVHGVRLNTLEFSTHKGLTWSGHTFHPFSRSS